MELSIDKGFNGEVQITNTLITATATPTPTIIQAPKTEDNNNIGWYFTLLVSALFVGLGTGTYRRKRAQK